MITTPTILVPGPAGSARSYDALVRTADPFGPTTVVDTRGESSIVEMAERLLADAPRRFVLVGLSTGGAVAFEVVRRAPERVLGLALISTTTAPDNDAERQSQLAGITCPTAVIHGAGDHVFSMAQARELAAAIPTAQLCVISNAGHAALLERPGPVCDALAGLLHLAQAGVAA